MTDTRTDDAGAAPDLPHADTRALVTGAAQGLGLAIAERLVAEGCRHIVLADRQEALGREVAAALCAGGVSAHFVAVEMGDTDAVARMVAAALEAAGGLTVLVNGAANTDRGGILDTTPEHWDAIVNPTLKGPFFALQGFARAAIAAGHGGAAVNIGSIIAHGGLPNLAPYGAAKAALGHVTRNAAHTLAPHGIRVNAVNVGWMDTPGEDATQRRHHGRAEGWQAAVAARLPFGAMVQPQDVARQVAFLLGPRSGVVTGSVMDFDSRVIGIYPGTDD